MFIDSSKVFTLSSNKEDFCEITGYIIPFANYYSITKTLSIVC